MTDPKERLIRKNAFDGSLVMGTANFNRNTGRQDSLHPPFSQYVDPLTGLIRGDFLRSRNCPVCDAPPGPGLFVKDGFRHVRCPNCTLIYVSLILREDLMFKYWREELAWTRVLQTGPQMDMDQAKFDYGLDLLTAYSEGGKILDIGTGTGFFLRQAGLRGWETMGLEINVESAESLRNEGIEVIVKPLELADLGTGSFDVICMWEVLEHLAEPKTVLAEARRLLRDDGVALILVPNSSSLVTRLLHEKSNTFGGHSHLNHFNPKSLTGILQGLHFDILEMETVITELGTINNYLNFEDPYLGNAPAFIPNLTPEVIHKNLWGSRLLVIAKPNRDRGGK
ncbi:MAG: class I SAM-dependent methyltransferase [Deltaproteobacteria bacterium]|nr:class I SAM-dependent methyltransferase [Deltaproteobacteria bacterium]